ncbi:MAG: hypothetical protein M1832_005623 [Thelocarpon impressellum]|nr:MAG: hypothetical protein M1832_005623 [Thelocarpon impressellum]
MSQAQPPKVLLFDIGGVCVVSPFQAILDYELKHGIPPGWVNFSISRTAPDGAWHQIERGEIEMDERFFAGFKRDLHHESLWEEFSTRVGRRSTPAQVVGAVGAAAGADVSAMLPPVPEIDAEYLFWEMMRVSRTPDPWMFPALKKLKASGRFIIGALSNAYIFPAGHPYNERARDDVRDMFDVFVSSAHVGLRKPDPAIYQLALRVLNENAKEKADQVDVNLKWAGGIEAEDVVFLDDIGANLKTAKQMGMRTIKVHLGKTIDAVRELETLTGLSLLEESGKSRL